MTSADLRARFLAYFQRHQHEIVRSSPLIPQNDPTLFFTNAGMVQFKDVFVGKDLRPYKRATTVQKCLRVSGKHNDLENVGHTPRHHTFFEMLGNFSFGDYFKTDAIRFAWDLLTNELGIDPDRLWVTVYEHDDEALQIWRDLAGVPAERIQKLGEADNFWAMGDTGPCGPCTEIHYDHGPGISDDIRGPAFGDPRYIEIWNLVFMQFERAADGSMSPLPRPSIDTGAGLERVAAVCQGVYANYDTDLFTPIMRHAAAIARADVDEARTPLRVIADHSRAAAFLIADGVMPSNEGRGYVLRRIMRRGIRYGVKLGINGTFLHDTVGTVIEHFGGAYPELVERAQFIRDVVKTEEERFALTVRRGLSILDGLAETEVSRTRVVPGATAFQLSDTYGFPVDLTELVAAERGWTVDVAGFKEHLDRQKQLGRDNWRGSGEAAVDAVWHELGRAHPSRFSGYEHEWEDATVVAILSEGAPVTALVEGHEGFVLLDRTPFYAESGGQVGDSGSLAGDGVLVDVLDTQKPVAELHAHQVRVAEGTLRVGMRVRARVDSARRDRTRLNHTGTHLLHAALREVLGSHVMQKGSLVGPERLRFDFSHHKAMSAEELHRVEDLVNDAILHNHAVETALMAVDDAKAAGAMALFGEKYGEKVRVVRVGEVSMELCGGTHARRSGDIGFFKITGESGIAAGVRRVEAQTGPGAAAWVRQLEGTTKALQAELRTDKLLEAVQRLQEERARLAKELEAARREAARAVAGDLRDRAVMHDGYALVAAEFAGDARAMRDEADRLRDSLGSAVVVLAGADADGVRVLCAVSKDLAGSRFHAGKIVGALAAMVGGKGGGRPDFAQAGGKEPEKLAAMLAAVPGILAG